MTSAIDASSIDENFPVAGIDNPSQGFRDNFNYIKIGLDTASAEITDLQNTTAKVNTDNDFNGVRLENAVINKFFGNVYNYSVLSTNTNINVLNGVYQLATIGANVTLTFTNWPATDLHAKLTLHLTATGVSRDVVFDSLVGNLKYSSNFPTGFDLDPTLTIDTGKHYIIDVWSVDNGDTVFLNYLGEYS